jgi:hypothetical protein
MKVCDPKKKRSFCLMLAAIAAAALIYAVRPAYALGAVEIRELQRKGQSSFQQGVALAQADPIRSADLFQKAALCFEAILREGGIENGKLYYNIGNCYLRMGDSGRAILNYLRAERMIPGDPYLMQNLNFARSKAPHAAEPDLDGGRSRVLLFWLYDLGFPEPAWIFLGFWGLIWTCRSAYLFYKKAWLRNAILGAAGAAVLVFALLAFQVYLDSGPQPGVIVAESVMGCKGESFAYGPAFDRPLQSGTEFKLLEERSGWLHIMLPGSSTCWVPAFSAEIV